MGKKIYSSLNIGPNFFLRISKINNLQFCEIVATKKGMTTIFFTPFAFVAVFGSGIRDPGSRIRDPRSGIQDPGSKIRDPGTDIQDPGSGMGKNQDPIQDPGSETLV